MWLQEFCVNGNNEDSSSRLYNDVQPKEKLEIAQSEQDVSPFCKESDMPSS